MIREKKQYMIKQYATSLNRKKNPKKLVYFKFIFATLTLFF